MRAKVFVCAALMALATAGQGAARDYEVVSVKAGEAAEVYFQVNLEGTLYLNIRAKDGEGVRQSEVEDGAVFYRKGRGQALWLRQTGYPWCLRLCGLVHSLRDGRGERPENRL